ncbi:hypothetical protein H6G27_26500 [Nostoc linckia FACHB-104]|nr:hypothetical protein [Nostoc linckia FACHB-104]
MTNDTQDNFPITFTRMLQYLCLSTKVSASVLCASAALLLPVVGLQERGLGKLLTSVVGTGAAAIGLQQLKTNKQLQAISEDLGIVERKQSIAWYSSLLSHKPALTVQMQTQPTLEPADVMRDIVSYWQQQDKHMLVIGGTGAGKSTFIQAFASVLGAGWHYKIYDTDCTCDDWLYLRSLPNCELYETFASIGEQMSEDLATIETRTVERKKAGNKWTTDNTLIVAEEMPALVDEIEIAGDWMAKEAKRGRRVKRYVAVIAQNDTVKNLGMEGDSALRDSCFVRVYLGQSAIDRAKLLKNKTLEDWLRAGDKQVCLVDDLPAFRPAFSTSNQFSTSSASEQPVTQTESQCSDVHQSSETDNNGIISAQTDKSERTEHLNNSPLTGVNLSQSQLQALRQLYTEGMSVSQILEQKLGQKRGGSWQRKKDWLTGLLEL